MSDETMSGPDWSTIARWAIALGQAGILFLVTLAWSEIQHNKGRLDEVAMEQQRRTHWMTEVAQLRTAVERLQVEMVTFGATRFTSGEGDRLRWDLERSMRRCCPAVEFDRKP